MAQKPQESEILAQLYDPAIFEEELLSMSAREFRSGYCTDVANREAWFKLIDHGKPLCRFLAREMRTGTYQPDPIEFREANLQGKKRNIARLSFRDRLVQGALAQTLHRHFEPLWHGSLFSFRRARSNVMALKEAGKFCHQHRRRTPTRNQGLYVLRGDVKNYTDSISPKPDSPLWNALESNMENSSRILSSLLQQVLALSGECLPFGSPLTPFFANLFLTPLDYEFNRNPALSCFRYGDDILALSENSELVLECLRGYSEALRNRGLAWNENKLKLQYWTANGHASPLPDFKGGLNQIEYLGLSLHFRHGLGMSKKHRKRFRAQVRERLRDQKADTASKWQELRTLWDDLQNTKNEASTETAQLYHDQWSPSQIQEERQFVLEQASEFMAGENAPRSYRKFPKRLLQNELGPLWPWLRAEP